MQPPNQPPPSNCALAIICVLCSFSSHHVFWPSQFVCLHHSPPRVFFLLLQFSFYLCFSVSVFLSHLPHLSYPPLMSSWWLSLIETGHLRSLQWHWEAKLPWMCACLCVCVTHCHHPQHNRGHTEFMFPAARAIVTPGTFLIINSNLNLTSNADPRDNIVVTISTQ